MTFFDQYLSPASRRPARKQPAKFSTVHLRIHSDVHAFLKEEAADLGLSIPATLERMLATRYKDRLHKQEQVLKDLGVSEDPDSQDE